MFELGGHPMVLRGPTSCSSRAASRSATPRSCSPATSPRSACARATTRELEELAEHATVPGRQHALAAAPPVPGARRPAHAARGVRVASRAASLAYVGDGNNVARSLAVARRAWRASRCVSLRPTATSSSRGAEAILTDDPAEAVAGADAVYTDVWVSMSDDEATAGGPPRGARALPDRRRAARPRRARARSRCTACPRIPARRSRTTVLYGARQRIWDQAENRRHAQKALLELLVSPSGSDG